MLSKRQIKYFKSLQLKKYRDQERLFMIEGAKGVEEALESSLILHSLIGTKDFLSTLSLQGLQTYEVKEEVLSQIGTFKSNKAGIAILEMPEYQDPHLGEDGITLVLDEVKDPGNLGTIIRIADWYGISQIICSQETADVYNPKVINATMGSFARVKVAYTNLEEVLSNSTLPIYGALLDGENIYKQDLSLDAVLVMGNESRGISPRIRKFISHPILIPGRGGAESLNVAVSTAVVLDNFFR